MRVRNNRIFIPITVAGPRGRKRAWFWVDTGGGTLAVSGKLAWDVGLQPLKADAVGDQAGDLVALEKPRLLLGGVSLYLSTTSTSTSGRRTSRRVFPGSEADGFLPAAVLQHYDVRLDYPHRLFELAPTGSLPHRGLPVPFSVDRASGFGRVELTIDRQHYGFMVDTGASFSGMSRNLADRLLKVHPSWPHCRGAVGAANMVGKEMDLNSEMLSIPDMQWDGLRLRDTSFMTRPAGVYEDVVGREMSAPIAGVIAGNVLRGFTIELDYPNGMAYLSRHAKRTVTGWSGVGLVLEILPRGEFAINGSAQCGGPPEVPGVQAGDILVRVHGHVMKGQSLAAVVQELTAAPGQTRTLTIRRGSSLIDLRAVARMHP